MMRASSWSMSIVWLTASAVRYMICRFDRGAASHGCDEPRGVGHQPFAAAGLAQRGDDPRAVVDRRARGTMSTLPARSSSRSSLKPV